MSNAIESVNQILISDLSQVRNVTSVDIDKEQEFSDLIVRDLDGAEIGTLDRNSEIYSAEIDGIETSFVVGRNNRLYGMGKRRRKDRKKLKMALGGAENQRVAMKLQLVSEIQQLHFSILGLLNDLHECCMRYPFSAAKDVKLGDGEIIRSFLSELKHQKVIDELVDEETGERFFWKSPSPLKFEEKNFLYPLPYIVSNKNIVQSNLMQTTVRDSMDSVANRFSLRFGRLVLSRIQSHLEKKYDRFGSNFTESHHACDKAPGENELIVSAPVEARLFQLEREAVINKNERSEILRNQLVINQFEPGGVLAEAKSEEALKHHLNVLLNDQ